MYVTHAFFAFVVYLRALYLRATIQREIIPRKEGPGPRSRARWQNQIRGVWSSGSYLSGHSRRWIPPEWAKCAWPVFRVAEKSKWDLAINRSPGRACQNHLQTESSAIEFSGYQLFFSNSSLLDIYRRTERVSSQVKTRTDRKLSHRITNRCLRVAGLPAMVCLRVVQNKRIPCFPFSLS